jgi:mannose-6-phosphate isomerase-like protein (cupin superfamily)
MPGDLASAPPNTIHQYQILGDYSEFMGVIVPGGWEEFFRFIGEPYDGPMFPLMDERNPFEVLIPKLKLAAEKFDMVPVRDHPYVAPQAWVQGHDNVLPGALEPYFLRAGTGPRYVLGPIVCSPLVTTAESAGRFSIGLIEGSSWHENSPMSEPVSFNSVHHAFNIEGGAAQFTVVGQDTATLQAGETIYIPKNTAFTINIKSRYAQIYVFVSGGGLVDLFLKAGKTYHQTIAPEKPDSWERRALESVQQEVGFQLG